MEHEIQSASDEAWFVANSERVLEHHKVRRRPWAEEVMAIVNMVEDDFLQQGVTAGKVEGKAEGQILAFRELLYRLLLQRFGEVPTHIQERIDRKVDSDWFLRALWTVCRMKSFSDLCL
jgi:hypothetical protein